MLASLCQQSLGKRLFKLSFMTLAAQCFTALQVSGPLKPVSPANDSDRNRLLWLPFLTSPPPSSIPKDSSFAWRQTTNPQIAQTCISLSDGNIPRSFFFFFFNCVCVWEKNPHRPQSQLAFLWILYSNFTGSNQLVQRSVWWTQEVVPYHRGCPASQSILTGKYRESVPITELEEVWPNTGWCNSVIMVTIVTEWLVRRLCRIVLW